MNETIGEGIKKARAICGRRWYAADNLMDTFCFPTMGLIENACLLKLKIEQVEQQWDDVKEKIQGLSRIIIDDVDHLIKQPFYIEWNIHIYIRIWHKLAKNEIEDHKYGAQLGLESANYPNLDELLEIWKIRRDFLRC